MVHWPISVENFLHEITVITTLILKELDYGRRKEINQHDLLIYIDFCGAIISNAVRN